MHLKNIFNLVCLYFYTQHTNNKNQKENYSFRNMKKFSCPDCEYKASKAYNLQRHINLLHKGIIFPCPDCEYTARRRDQLQTHIQSVHKGVTFSCEDCEYTGKRKGDLQKHIQSIHKGITFQQYRNL